MTITIQLAALLLVVVAVIIEKPSFKVLISPFSDTVATDVSLLVQLIEDAFALVGSNVATKLNLSPAINKISLTFKLIFVGNISFSRTLTTQLAVLSLFVLTVIVPLPTPSALTTPPSTLTTLSLLLVQIK